MGLVQWKFRCRNLMVAGWSSGQREDGTGFFPGAASRGSGLPPRRTAAPRSRAGPALQSVRPGRVETLWRTVAAQREILRLRLNNILFCSESHSSESREFGGVTKSPRQAQAKSNAACAALTTRATSPQRSLSKGATPSVMRLGARSHSQASSTEPNSGQMRFRPSIG